MARVLKARKNPLTIELLFLDGEEAFCRNWDECGRPGAPDNTYGSRHYVVDGKARGTLAGIKANILVDMIADRDLRLKRDLNSTPWLTDIIWAAAKRRKLDAYFVPETTADRGRPPPVPAGGRAVGRRHRSRIPAVAHGRRYAGRRQRPKPADRRRRGPRRAPADRSPLQIE